MVLLQTRGRVNITTKPLAQLVISDIVATVVWVIIGFILLRALFKPNPRPDYQEAWGTFGLVLGVGVLVLGAVFFISAPKEIRPQR